MIVRDPPYELIALFADLDAQRFFEQLIERGQQSGCLRSFNWRSLRDPRRDTVWRSPQAALLPIRRKGCRLFLSWDLEGSGAEDDGPDNLEAYARNELRRSDVADEDILAVCYAPELEKVLGVAWSRVKEVVANVRGGPPPDDARVLSKSRLTGSLRDINEIEEALRLAPKEVFEGLVAAVQLRTKPDLFESLGRQLSIPLLKQDSVLKRVAAKLAEWFPGTSATQSW
jgi:hypothetical protein